MKIFKVANMITSDRVNNPFYDDESTNSAVANDVVITEFVWNVPTYTLPFLFLTYTLKSRSITSYYFRKLLGGTPKKKTTKYRINKMDLLLKTILISIYISPLIYLSTKYFLFSLGP